MVGLFPFGPDQRVASLGFEIKNRAHLDQINRPIRPFHPKSLYDPFHRHDAPFKLSPVCNECFIAGVKLPGKTEISRRLRSIAAVLRKPTKPSHDPHADACCQSLK
jgi:hypothetical protein